ncbi:DUF6035 family protein [Aquamicrobium lusatiense]|uniref:DUF6035 family protein n=1 Tax=Aquamicrobium lusatiense TaxID=89772 RepID=UPI002458CC28|nr:DUF6035 family protein [Aquamicrobium lusatiense]MDH4992230.1 DUF6035 family protein [Aquamicrobium lusatiense]
MQFGRSGSKYEPASRIRFNSLSRCSRLPYHRIMGIGGLTVEAIFVDDGRDADQPIRTEAYLYSLSETEWTDLRAEATRSRRAGKALLRCGDCRSPVYARESTNGRRHCYHFGTEVKDCLWASANARNARSIDAEKFHGNQESERHKNLKAMICENLALDPDAAEAGIVQERYTKGTDGTGYAFPDVFAVNWQGDPAAFEIQLATTQLPNIVRREDFYEANGIRLVWIIGSSERQLERRAFKDIYLRNDGQILGLDGDVMAAARKAGAPRFRLYRLLPGPVSKWFAPDWKMKIVAPDELDWGAAGSRPRSVHFGYDAYLDQLVEKDPALADARRRFYAVLAESDHSAAGPIWNEVADKVGGMRWEDLASPYDAVRAFGVLATIRKNEITVKTKIGISDLPHLINSMLLEPADRRCWTHAFKLLARVVRPELLTVDSVAQKCRRNDSEHGAELPPDLGAGQVFNVFFPEGAFGRLQRQSAGMAD